MNGLFGMFRRGEARRRQETAAATRKVRRKASRTRSHVESLEKRAMLTIITDYDNTTGELTLTYDPTNDQHAILEIEEIPFTDILGNIFSAPWVSMYAVSNPATGGPAYGDFGTPVAPGAYATGQFLGVQAITVVVQNFDTIGVNGNSVTIKGISTEVDRIILGGAGRTAAGRWSDEGAVAPNLTQVLLEITGIDDITVTAGGVINVSGEFTNDTNDASIKAFGTIPEDATGQHRATVVVGEAVPVPGTLPQPGLFSNFIEVVGAELDILGDILATDQVILRAGEKTDVGESLVLPYDITVTGSLVTPSPGRLELFSTKNIVQLASSTITASEMVAVSNDADIDAPAGPWMIDLGSENNDFDRISLGMVSAPGDAVTEATEGRIGVRDRDDLTVADFGILAATGRVRIDVAGALTFAAPIQATGLIGESDHSITSTDTAIMRLGVLGIELYANDTFDTTATGDVTLRGPIRVDKLDVDGIRDTTLVANKIQAVGLTTIVGGIYSPLAGSTSISSNAGIVVDGPIQGGSTQLNADSTVATCYDHDVMLISHLGAITVNDRPGGDAIPRTIQATNIVSFDALDTITIGGSVFAGTLYGNALDLVETEALPAITIIGDADVIVTASGSLETQAYENDHDKFANPLLGRISVDAETQYDLRGWMKADGPIDITSTGDIYLHGAVTARESIDVESRQGSIDVQGAVRTTGWTYTTTPPAPLLEQRMPDITLAATQGAITTSFLGVLSAGAATLQTAAEDFVTNGVIRLSSQQDIALNAAIDTLGDVFATSSLGSVILEALVRTRNPLGDATATIVAANGITQAATSRIVGKVIAANTGLFDPSTPTGILLTSFDNEISAFAATNGSIDGVTRVNNAATTSAVGPIEAAGDVDYVSVGTINVTGVVHTNTRATAGNGDILVQSTGGGINVSSSVIADVGTVRLVSAGEVIQRGGSLVTVFLLSGGRNYRYAEVEVDPPPGAGDRALVTATIIPYPSPPFDGVIGFIGALTIVDPGWGYFSGQRVGMTIKGDGVGASAVGVASIVSSSIEGAAGVDIEAVEKVTLVNAVRSTQGDVAITSRRGDMAVQSVTALSGRADILIERGGLIIETVAAESGISIKAQRGVEIRESANTTDGDVDIYTVNGDLDFRGTATVVNAEGGKITLQSLNGSILTPPVLNATDGISIKSFGTLSLNNSITTIDGDVVAESTSGGVILNSFIKALDSSIKIAVKNDFVAQGIGGCSRVLVVDGGSGYSDFTFVTFAAPTNPPVGVTPYPAYGRPIIRNGEIVQIIILSPGQGYFVGEQIAITVTDPDDPPGEGAIAVGFCERPQQSLYAKDNIDISVVGSVLLAGRVQAVDGNVTVIAQEGVTVQDSVNSAGGDITFRTVNRNLDFSDTNAILSCENGSVELSSFNGAILTPPVLHVTGDITIQSYQPLTIVNPNTSDAGNITLRSTNGALAINAIVVADDRLTLVAKLGIAQQSPIMARELDAMNGSPTAITLNNIANDVESVALRNPTGAVNYVDADGFETGLVRGPGSPPVEITGINVALQSLAPFSTIRVVSGLQYKSLSIGAGNTQGVDVGMVEFVTTSTASGNVTGPFTGSLRDMIRYVNDNTATYTANFQARSQPMSLVFDESGYPVATIAVSAALPTINRPVVFDGGRLEESVLLGGQTRLNLTQSASVPYGLAFSPAIPAVPGKSPAYPGSAGSTIQHLAAYGFASGSAVVLGSGNNRVLDFRAGLMDDGTVAGNFIGLDVTGATASNNQIGVEVFDPATVNRFGGNKSAGILIRNGASGNRVYGNVIGDDTGITPGLANGDGIRISNATRNWIGTPDEVQIDLTPSRSNLIMGNSLAGIQISSSVGGSATAANMVRNNYIAGNRTGVAISSSRFAVLGGTDGMSANVIVNQSLAGVAVADSSNVVLQGNRIGIMPEFGVDLEAVAGNGGDGVAITGKSQQVQISDGNWIGGNGANGVSIGTGVTGATLTGNKIGGTLADGTAAGNTVDGVAVTAAIGNVVGVGNAITENLRHGVSVTDARAATLMTGNKVFGSTIAGNGVHGVFLSGGSATTIGGLTAGAGNIITANAGSGIRVEGSTRTGAGTGHAIQGNRVGTNANGDVDSALGNTLSGISLAGTVGVVVGGRNVVMNNAARGVEIVGGTGVTVGAATPADGNLITNNGQDGVSVGGGAVTGIVVMGNTIATNGEDGVEIAAGTTGGVSIGQTVTQRAVTGAGNVIRGNQGYGVRIRANAQQIGVQGNSIHDNALGAIFRAPSANSVAPTVALTSATIRIASGNSRQLQIVGSLTGAGIVAKQQYSVDVYANPAGATNPQARRFLGRFTVTATRNGSIAINTRLTAIVGVDEWITATATSLVYSPGSTSSLSNAVRAGV